MHAAMIKVGGANRVKVSSPRQRLQVRAVFIRSPAAGGHDAAPERRREFKRVEVGEASFKQTGKTVVITGGSQGIGRATAILFAKKGFNVVVAARDKQRLQYVAQDCAEAAGRRNASMAVPTDVTNNDSVYDLVNTVLAKFETVDVVINNAGIFSKGNFLDTPVEEARRLMEINYLGPYQVAQAFLPVLANTAKRHSMGVDKPSLIFVNSFASKVPVQYMSAFTASKSALAGLTTAIRPEVEAQGVHVGQVHPGMVKSNHMERAEFYGKESETDRRAWLNALRMLPVAQKPDEVANHIYNMYVTKQREAVVGPAFQMAAMMNHFTGFNPSNVPIMQ